MSLLVLLVHRPAEQFHLDKLSAGVRRTTIDQELMRPMCASAVGQQRRNAHRRSGFSMLEMLIVLIVIAILVAITVPKISLQVRHERVNRAAQVMVQDLQNGFAVAGRQRAPVRLTFTPSTLTYVFTDRATGTVLQKRIMATGSEYSLTSLTSDYNSVDILPNGIGSTQFVVTLKNGDYQRKVTASSAGFIRMTPQ